MLGERTSTPKVPSSRPARARALSGLGASRRARGKVVHRFGNDHELYWVRSLAITSDGRAIAAGSAGGTLRLLDLTTGEVLQRWQVDTSVNRRASLFIEVSNV